MTKLLAMIKKLLMDLTTDDFGKDFDIVNLEATLGFAIGIIMFIVSQVKPNWLPKYDLLTYAGGVGALLTATGVAQRVRPPATPPTEDQK